MSISSVGSNASQIWQQQRGMRAQAQQASSTNAASATKGLGRGSFPGVPGDADGDSDGTSVSKSANTGTGTGGNSGISGTASKLIADVNSLLLSLQAGNSATGATPAASSAGTASSAATATGTGATSAAATTSAASSGTTSSATVGSLSQDQLAGVSTVLSDLSKVHGGSHHHHGHGAPPSGAQSADASGTSAAAIPGASTASPVPPASGSSPSDLLAQLGKALSAYGTSQASATSQPSTLLAA